MSALSAISLSLNTKHSALLQICLYRYESDACSIAFVSNVSTVS